MNDDKLNTLNRITAPAPSDGARRRALEAAMLAFDAEQQKSVASTQGASIRSRLRSIVHTLRGNWIMDTRISLGLGTAAVALLLLPLGYQLYLSTAMTPASITTTSMPEPEPVPVPPGSTPAPSRPPSPAEPVAEATAKSEVDADRRVMQQFAITPGEAFRQESSERKVRLLPVAPSGEVASNAAPGIAADAAAPVAPTMAEMARGTGVAAGHESFGGALDTTGIRPVVPSGDEFTDFAESPVKVTAEAPVSTFSVDVDTASYAYVRRMLEEGYQPEPDAVRIEEMINYFDYSYPGPDSATTPFKATVQVYPTPWNPRTQLVQIGIKGYVPPATEDKASNLVFLIDTSGSMDEPDKLPLLKRAFGLLVDQLSANDTVSIVAYAGSAGVVLDPTRATDKATILGALDNLWAGGSTAGADGIELAYQLAAQNKVAGGINRVILATDGDFNVGIDDPADLVDFIKSKRDQGIFLSVLGFGQGNLGDDTMQALAQNGNGVASYIDSYKEAQKVLVQEIGGTLETIAKDVKVQVEFNPAVVAEYRLVGYETRALAREDFNNDKVDAGDIGAGHTVTALYEITPVGSGAELVDPLRYGGQPAATASAQSDEIGFLRIRYKLPEGTTSELMETPITRSLGVESVDAAAEDSRWAAAVAAFSQKLKDSNYGGTMSWDEIRALAQGARGPDPDGYRAEFMQLINSAAAVARD